MNHSKVHSLGKVKVPFAWENAPGISKVSPKEWLKDVGQETHKLPLPPCPSDSAKVGGHDLQIPLPPCPFQPPLRSSSKKGNNREDPFLAAYLECTKSVGHGKSSKIKHKVGVGSMLGRRMFWLSCKRPSAVREDSSVRPSHLPHTPSEDFRR